MVKTEFAIKFNPDYVFGDDGNLYLLPRIDAAGKQRRLKRIDPNITKGGYSLSDYKKAPPHREFYTFEQIHFSLVKIETPTVLIENQLIPKDQLPWNKKKKQ